MDSSACSVSPSAFHPDARGEGPSSTAIRSRSVACSSCRELLVNDAIMGVASALVVLPWTIRTPSRWMRSSPSPPMAARPSGQGTTRRNGPTDAASSSSHGCASTRNRSERSSRSSAPARGDRLCDDAPGRELSYPVALPGAQSRLAGRSHVDQPGRPASGDLRERVPLAHGGRGPHVVQPPAAFVLAVGLRRSPPTHRCVRSSASAWPLPHLIVLYGNLRSGRCSSLDAAVTAPWVVHLIKLRRSRLDADA